MERGRDGTSDSHVTLKETNNMCLIMIMNVCDTDPVWSRKLWLLYLEIDESRQGDAIEKPGSETTTVMKRSVRHMQTSYSLLKQVINKCQTKYTTSRTGFYLK